MGAEEETKVVYGELPVKVGALKETMENLPEFQNISYKHSFEGYMKRIQQIDGFNRVDRYRIVFIGEPGKGKTTAICNWLDLLKKNKENEKRIEAISLLATASGRTTVAEVHIKQVADASRIRVEYMSIDQQKEYIKEYCNYYYSRCLDVTDDNTDDMTEHNAENVHLEIDRVIRNMASIEDIPSGVREHSIEKRNKILSFIKTFENEVSFYEYILEKIDLDHRQCSIIPYQGEMDFEQWLSRTFKEINDGKRSDCSIASKIYVDIYSEDLFLALPDYIEEIIDTIGLDSSVRTDLQDLMLAEDTICFLMDDLKNVPSSNIRNLLKETFLNDWDQYCTWKTSIFVKSPIKELEAVNEAEGDSDVGIEIKANELKRRVGADKIPYKMDNTLFLDSCAAYIFKSERIYELDENGKPVISEYTKKPKFKNNQVIEKYDDDIAFEYRQEVTNKIRSIIEQLKERLQKDADKIRAEVENLLELERNFVNTEVDNELFEIRKKVAERKMKISRVRGMDIVEDILKKTIDNIHWRTIKKMNSLYGGYQMWHTDIYTQIMQVGKESFLKAIEPVSSEINQLLIDVRNKEARSITGGYLNQYKLMVKEGTEKMGQRFFQWAWNEGFAPQSDANSFWYKVNRICGSGYKRRVRDQYEEVVYDDGGMMARMITAEVEKTVDKLLCLFPDN